MWNSPHRNFAGGNLPAEISPTGVHHTIYLYPKILEK